METHVKKPEIVDAVDWKSDPLSQCKGKKLKKLAKLSSRQKIVSL